MFALLLDFSISTDNAGVIVVRSSADDVFDTGDTERRDDDRYELKEAWLEVGDNEA